MKNFKMFFSLTLLLSMATAQNSLAQVFNMVVDDVKPSMIQEYEEALKGYMEFMTENDYSMPIEVYSSRELRYYYATPMEFSYADLDTIWMAMNEVTEKDQEGFDEIFSKFFGTYNTSKSYCMYLSKSLSYIPEEEADEGEELHFLEVWTAQVTLGKAEELHKLIKEYNAICKENNVTLPIWVYRGLIGMDQGTYVIVSPGKNPADLWKKNVEAYKMLGEEGHEVNDKILKLFDKMELEHIWYRKDLSYKPAD